MTPITIRPATPNDAPFVARLIMAAMTDECCLYFCGRGHGLQDFRSMITALVRRTDSQYSYLNTLVAEVPENPDETVENLTPAGISVAYDGARLHELRRAFVDMARQQLGRDHSQMADETQAGELYLDSFAVEPRFRRRGIGTRLLRATAERARAMGLPRVGLLVDEANPSAERLYRSAGFRHADNNLWGGHPMRHLVLDV